MNDPSLMCLKLDQASRNQVRSVTDDASSSLATNHIQTREFDQNWENQDPVLMDVEDDDLGTGNESNPCIDVQLD